MQNIHLNNMKIKKFQFGGPGGFTADRKEIERRNKAFGALRKKTAQAGLATLGWLGNAFNTVLTAGASSDFGQTSPFVDMDRHAIAKARENTRLKAKETVEKATPYISPANHITAWTQGSFNPIVGAQKLEQLGPEAQLAGAIFDIATLSKGKPAIRGTVRAVDKGLARVGSKGARGRVIARELDKNITEATKNGRIEVTDKYFNSPNHWYRVSERPEKMGLEEQGTNVTTLDDAQTPGTANGWRTSILQKRDGIDIVPDGQGYFKTKKARFQFSKNGAAHGNTSQAAKGKIWDGTFALSGKFPNGIIEGTAPSKVHRGMNAQGLDSRTEFVPQNWEEVPMGARIGFHTGEMPMSNLGWFQKTNRGTFTYEPIIPEKRLTFDPNKKFKLLGSQPRLLDSKTYPWYTGPRFSINDVVNPNGTVNPRQAMTVQHSVADWFGQKAHRMENRLENSKWHKNDPTTYDHTKQVARSAWQLPTPKGFTKQDQMVSALGHDFGKMVAGEGHAQIGADLARQVFPDLTDAQYTAIAEHMGQPKTPLGKVTKQADIDNGRSYVTDKKGNRQLIAQHNQWASQYGYPTLPYNLSSSNIRTNRAVRGTIARHNSFYRGINPKMAEPTDIQHYMESLAEGEQPTTQGFIRFAATTPRSEGAGIFVSPFSANSSIYGNGVTNLVRRKYKLGPDKNQWFKEGDFEVQSIYDKQKDFSNRPVFNPWERIRYPFEPKPNNGTVPANELLLFDNMHYVGPRSYKATGETTNKTNVTVWNETPQINKIRNNIIYTDDYGLQEMPFELYFENKVNSLPKDLVDKSPISNSELEYKQEAYNTMDFTPKYRMSVGKLNEAWGQEILRRLRNLGYNTSQDGQYIMGQHKVITNPEQYVKLNSKNKVTLGYFNHEGGENGGFYGGYWNEAAIDPTNVKSIPSAALHERVMHGTDKMLEGIQYNQGGNAQHIYQDFINRIFYDNEGNLKPGFKEDSKGNIAFNGYRIYKDDLNWKEGRATIAELARKLYVKVKGDNKITSIQDLEKFRPAFEKEVDTNPNLLESLSKINGYGQTYSKVGPATNPAFLEELKWLLKYAPAGTPLIFRYNEEK